MTSSLGGVYFRHDNFLSILMVQLTLYIAIDDKSRKVAPHPINIVKMADTPTNQDRAPPVLWTNGRRECLCLLSLNTTCPR